jgi:hypothetical protein
VSKLKLDLHEIFNKGKKIDQALNDIIDEAVEKKDSTYRDYSRKRKWAIEEKCNPFSRAETHQSQVSSYR